MIEALNHPVVLALTATASPLVRREIIERLGMVKPAEIVRGFNRPNIHLSVRLFHEEAEKRQSLLKALSAAQMPGIVYVATRKAAERIAQDLADSGLSAAAYHAGMKGCDRDEVQTRFMQNEIDIIVATTAFGMGIDKADIGFVYHYHVPGSVAAYYQEIGRAARNGESAAAILFYLADDMKLQRFFSGGAQLEAETMAELAEFLEVTETPPTETQLKEHFDLSWAKIRAALDSLESAGFIERGSGGEIVEVAEVSDVDSAVDQALSVQRRRKQFDRSRLEMMRGYAETEGCRRKYVLSYFGEVLENACEGCDHCEQ